MNQYILPFKSGSLVAELGGAENPTFHPNIDIRKMPNVDIVADFNKSLSLPNNSYDGIFSKYNLEHLSWRRIRPFIRDVFRILRPKGIAVFITANLLEQAKAIVNAQKLDDTYVSMIFGGQRQTEFKDEEIIDKDWDSNSHHSGFSPEYITEILQNIGFNNIKIIPIQTDKGLTDMVIECSKSNNNQQDRLITDVTFSEIKETDSNNMLEQFSTKVDHCIKLNMGSFTVMHSNNWVNTDILDLDQYARQNNFIFKQSDMSQEIPYKDNEVSLISASHFIEHLDRPHGKQFLKEVLRVLEPGGIIRLTVPDAEIVAKDYLSRNIARHSSHNEGVKNSDDDAQSLYELLIAGHKTIYDFQSLSKLLEKVGFVDIEKMEYQKSKSKIIQKENIDMYPQLSLYIEAVKPNINRSMCSPTGPIITKGNLPDIKYDDKSTPPISEIIISEHKISEHKISEHKISEHKISEHKISEHKISEHKISEHKISEQKQYKFSIVYPTYRPGSMDLLFSSLSKQTYKNFELMLVDDYPQRTNNKQELYNNLPNKEKPKYLKFHDSPKPDCFNKFYKFGTTVNTGIIFATIKSDFNSDIIIFLQDYTYLPPDQLEKWNDAFNETGLDTIITGTATILSAPEPTKWNDSFSVWDDSITESILNVKSEEEFKNVPGFKYHSQWTPVEYEGFYTGIPKDIVVKLNGLDENIDYPCEQVNDFFERAKIAGYKLVVNKELNCYMMDHRSWHPPDTKDDYMWHIERIESLRKDKAPERYPLEYYAQKVKDGKRNIKAENCFDLIELSQINLTSLEKIKPIIHNVENAYKDRIKFQIDNATKCKGKLLNIGCGDCYPFVNSNLDILHIDTTDQVSELVKPKVNFKLMDAHNLPFKDNEFGCSILGDTLEHVTNPVQILKEAKRVANNVYITVPNEYGWDKSLNPFNNPGHVRLYTYDSLVKVLDEGLGKDTYNIVQYDGGGWSFWCASYEEQKKLKIGIISTPFFKVPPDSYGGLEQVVYDIANGLDELGHQVTIFGPKGSKATKNGHAVEMCDSHNTANVDWYELEKECYNIYKNIINDKDFDIIHSNTWFGFPYLLKQKYTHLKICHTHHGFINWTSPPPIEHPNIIAISNFMKNIYEQQFKQKGYNVSVRFVRNGIDIDKYKFDPTIKKSNRLLYIGRFSRFKRPDMAIRIAKITNIPLDLIGGSFVDDPNYMNQIESMCDGNNIVMYKDSLHDFKIKKLQEAKALIVPSKMNEPYGLTCVEGMSCGIPIICTRDGAIPEIVIDGETGFICDTEEQMIEAIKNIDKIDPLKCRKRAEELSRLNMAKNYEKLYYKMIKGEEW